MATISANNRIRINAPPSEVFKYISELRLYYLWNPSQRKLSTEEPLSLGKTFDSRSVVLRDIEIKSHNTVTKFVPNKLLELSNKMGMIKYTSEFKLTKIGKSTLLLNKTSILTEGQLFGLTLPVLKQLASRELQSDLALLKIAVENKLGEKQPLGFEE